MTPKHDEITKRLDDGVVVAWDTNKVDDTTRREVEAVVREQAAELGKLFDVVLRTDDGIVVGEVKRAPGGARRSATPHRSSRAS